MTIPYKTPLQRRREWIRKYQLTLYNPARVLTHKFMDQLDSCKDEESRRLLLGVSGRGDGNGLLQSV